ncbi:MAG: hypothetical protein ABIP14_01550, partial [Blastocatellia bacterium]
QLLQALIATVCQAFGRFVKAYLAAFEKPQVVLSTAAVCGANDQFGLPINHKLRLERVPLLLAAVASTLFWGRWKHLALIKALSTLLTVRQTVASETPQLTLKWK